MGKENRLLYCFIAKCFIAAITVVTVLKTSLKRSEWIFHDRNDSSEEDNKLKAQVSKLKLASYTTKALARYFT